MASSRGSSIERRRTMMKGQFRVCFCFRRKFKVKAGDQVPEEIKGVFEKYSTNGTMSVEELHKFMVGYQGENGATKEDAQNIYDSVKHLRLFYRRGLHLDAFFRYLLGDINGPLRMEKQDMNAPLAHYFLYTGHNSYLTGNQITSDSSIQPIISALQKSVRVIELDLWPNSRSDDAEVRHGGTLTAPVALRDCLEAIKKYAFEASEYPVVITFEDHLDSRLQAKVAKMVKEIFGDMLYCPDLIYTEQTRFPSPETLKGKVMISTKPPEYRERVDISDEEFDEDLTDYRNLIAIHAGKPKGSVEHWLASQGRVRRVSLSEQELENVSVDHGTDIVRFTQNNLLRVYPKGARLDSSNYDPMIGWTHGAQMVAFNMQGHGKYLWIMEGMFRGNNEGCGYVKKPDILLDDVDVFDPSATHSLPVKQALKVMVYMGEGWHSDFGGTDFDLYSPPDFFVKVGITGVAADSTRMRRTKAIEDQWIPVWNEEFRFELRVPELALLRIEVMEYDTSGKHDFGGQTCLPVSLIKPGIRAVPLYTREGQLYPSVRLLMAFHFVRPDSIFY
ncbi:hypothetical protein QN277_018289 [Acacia crassicarpa]|uniref:Phosphoinositide phospholipase C n=2 Tax=Acacia crassicarpa TaxID=499986 RepID=A0AAE1JW55_9FABA|nr:hypothetical protein QN277_018289 [Acacia crassicarpa]